MRPTIHHCKCHSRPYTVCQLCGAEYCPSFWRVCPRVSWHPAHGTTAEEIAARYIAQQNTRRLAEAITAGCVDACHTDRLVTPSESARWHGRSEAKRIRARAAKGQAGKGYGA